MLISLKTVRLVACVSRLDGETSICTRTYRVASYNFMFSAGISNRQGVITRRGYGEVVTTMYGFQESRQPSPAQPGAGVVGSSDIRLTYSESSRRDGRKYRQNAIRTKQSTRINRTSPMSSFGHRPGRSENVPQHHPDRVPPSSPRRRRRCTYLNVYTKQAWRTYPPSHPHFLGIDSATRASILFFVVDGALYSQRWAKVN